MSLGLRFAAFLRSDSCLYSVLLDDACPDSFFVEVAWMTKRLLSVAVLLTGALPILADDWPQFRGPDRTDISKERGLLPKWPAAGPRLLWTFEQGGSGYSGPAVV